MEPETYTARRLATIPHHGKSTGIPQRFCCGDEENQEEGENGISMEFKRDRHDAGKGNERDFRQTRQIDHAEAVRGDIANDKPEEDGKLLIERVCFKIPRKAGDKRDVPTIR